MFCLPKAGNTEIIEVEPSLSSSLELDWVHRVIYVMELSIVEDTIECRR